MQNPSRESEYPLETLLELAEDILSDVQPPAQDCEYDQDSSLPIISTLRQMLYRRSNP